MKVKIVSVLICLMLSNTSHAGFTAITWHSRANCINNESVTWDFTHSWDMRTESEHNSQTDPHRLDTGWEKTKRSAAICWGEGLTKPDEYGWGVAGFHHVMVNGFECIYTTSTKDCSIYDGWWGEGDEPDHDPNIPENNKSYANYLINFNEIIRENRIFYYSTPTGLRNNFSEIKTSLKYKPVSGKRFLNIGFSPAGNYDKKKGWSGIKQYFSFEGIGICSYTILVFDSITNKNNGNNYNKKIEGNPTDNYLYSVTWVTGKQLNLVECSSKKRDDNIMKNVMDITEIK